MTTPRRGRLEIWADILKAVAAEAARSGPHSRTTRVRSAANVPYDRFQKHLEALAERGLVGTDPLTVTREGMDFLRMTQTVRGTAAEPVDETAAPGAPLAGTDVPQEDEPIGL